VDRDWRWRVRLILIYQLSEETVKTACKLKTDKTGTRGVLASVTFRCPWTLAGGDATRWFLPKVSELRRLRRIARSLSWHWLPACMSAIFPVAHLTDSKQRRFRWPRVTLKGGMRGVKFLLWISIITLVWFDLEWSNLAW